MAPKKKPYRYLKHFSEILVEELTLEEILKLDAPFLNNQLIRILKRKEEGNKDGNK